MSVFGIVADAVKALVPLPLMYPVRVVAPVPPLATESVPPRFESVKSASDTSRVGLPETPSPLETVSLDDPAEMVRAATVPDPVLLTSPFDAN